MKMKFSLIIVASLCCTVLSVEIPPPNDFECGGFDFGEDKVSCKALGEMIPIGGGLYDNYGTHYNVMFSTYYGARLLDALGYDKCCLAKNTTQTKQINVISPWSGIYGSSAIDTISGFDRNVVRKCEFPTMRYPFLCTGAPGTPGTRGENFGTLSFISLLHDEIYHRWTLFGNCWNAQSPENPTAVPTATSFVVLSLDSKLRARDRSAIIAKLKQLGFSTTNIIEPDYVSEFPLFQC